MKVALISPRVLRLPFPPLGLLYIGGTLEKDGHKVAIFDPEPQDDSFMEEVKMFNPDLVGFSIKTSEVGRAERLMSATKKLLPNVPIVCGGIHPTACYESMMKNPDVDFIVVGEGERTISEAVRRLEAGKGLEGVQGVVYREDGRIVVNQPRPLIEDLDEVPFPARHLLDFEKYLRPPGVIRGVWCERSTTIMTSRGCPGRCIYCGSKKIFGRSVRYRSVEDSIAEVEHLIKTYKVDGLWFADDTFTVRHDWVTQFCNQLKERGINIKWGCESRVNTITPELCRLMRSAGCIQMEFGVESGSPKVLNAIKKDTNPEMIRTAFRMAKEAGIRRLATFMIGCPEETKEDVEMTLRLAKEIKPDFTLFFTATPFPGTELYDMAVRNSWIKEADYSKWFVRTPSMEINFTRDELTRMRARLQNSFTARNFLPLLSNPKYGLKLMGFMMKNPAAFSAGLRKFVKTRNFDDFTFEFYNRSKNPERKRPIDVYGSYECY